MTFTKDQVRCSNCDQVLPPEQIEATMADALPEYMDDVTFCCSTYTEEQGCQGNDPDEIAYWYTR